MSIEDRRLERGVKHVLDRVLALVLSVAFSPVMAAVAIWVLLDDGRPILFAQPRVGKGGRVFSMLKFRTMVRDAQERAARLGEDPFGIVPNDPRITASGRWLRRMSLDELPQLWNVLLGEMSFVGPRPDIPEQAAHYGTTERRRLSVLPGITGWAQINGRDEITWPERFEMDRWYIENWSLLLDLRIMLRTIPQLLRGEPSPIQDDMNARQRKGQQTYLDE